LLLPIILLLLSLILICTLLLYFLFLAIYICCFFYSLLLSTNLHFTSFAFSWLEDRKTGRLLFLASCILNLQTGRLFFPAILSHTIPIRKPHLQPTSFLLFYFLTRNSKPVTWNHFYILHLSTYYTSFFIKNQNSTAYFLYTT